MAHLTPPACSWPGSSNSIRIIEPNRTERTENIKLYRMTSTATPAKSHHSRASHVAARRLDSTVRSRSAHGGKIELDLAPTVVDARPDCAVRVELHCPAGRLQCVQSRLRLSRYSLHAIKNAKTTNSRDEQPNGTRRRSGARRARVIRCRGAHRRRQPRTYDAFAFAFHCVDHRIPVALSVNRQNRPPVPVPGGTGPEAVPEAHPQRHLHLP